MDIKTINKHLATIADCNGIVEISVMETSAGNTIRYFKDYQDFYYDKGDNDRVLANEDECESIEWRLGDRFFPRNFDEIDFMAIKDIYDFYDAMGVDYSQEQ